MVKENEISRNGSQGILQGLEWLMIRIPPRTAGAPRNESTDELLNDENQELLLLISCGLCLAITRSR